MRDPKFVETITAIAEEAAHAAGTISRKAFLKALPSQFNVEQKKGYFDIVTVADREAEAAARGVIEKHRPHSRILGEEDGWTGAGEPIWFIDPIDGTSNFASGLPFFCVSLAAYSGGRGVCSVVYDPIREEMIVASGDRLTLNGETVTRVARGKRDCEVELLTNAPYEGDRPSAADLERFADWVSSFRAVRRLGSCALHLAYVALGRVAVSVESKFNAWDIAAGMHLVEASGGQVLAWDGNGVPVTAPFEQVTDISRLVVASPEFHYAASVLSA